jgi:mono/diheme cytochrome c family protein
MYPSNGEENFSSNGARIYDTGYHESGQKIKTEYGTHWLYVHGKRCVNCHRTDDGKGGYPVIWVMKLLLTFVMKPLLLVSGKKGKTIRLIQRTLSKGLLEKVLTPGEPLDLTMPRWEMSDKDLNDTGEYLKAL